MSHVSAQQHARCSRDRCAVRCDDWLCYTHAQFRVRKGCNEVAEGAERIRANQAKGLSPQSQTLVPFDTSLATCLATSHLGRHTPHSPGEAHLRTSRNDDHPAFDRYTAVRNMHRKATVALRLHVVNSILNSIVVPEAGHRLSEALVPCHQPPLCALWPCAI